MGSHPGPRPLKGVAEKYKEDVDQKLGAQHLLAVAQRELHIDCELYPMWDLAALPLPDTTHRDYNRIFQYHQRCERENAINLHKQKKIMLGAWTSILNQLLEACKVSHPALHRDLIESCRLDKRTDETYVAGG